MGFILQQTADEMFYFEGADSFNFISGCLKQSELFSSLKCKFASDICVIHRLGHFEKNVFMT